MNFIYKKILLLFIVSTIAVLCKGQMVITNMTTAQALAQKLVGDGVSISNVTFTGNNLMAGYFNNAGHPNPAIDSGIVLTSGRAKSGFTTIAVDGNGVDLASDALASEDWGLNGDADLASQIGVVTSETNDACILEFDFIPLGDSVKFRYSFSSEEYTEAFVCDYNDAFAFLISGPGFPAPKNIALIPGTNTPVSIFNVNDVAFGSCPNNMSYFIDNTNNTFFTHDGLTTILTALAKVQPCQTYHLKLVIADVADGAYDSGVFLEAKSLTSNAFQLTNITQTDVIGNSYLVEGCVPGSMRIRRPLPESFSQTINLGYGGSAVNGVDVQTLPSSITIPANQTEVLLNILPIVDNLPEGIETLKIYTLALCGVLATPTDSTIIQIRDYDTLGVTTSALLDSGIVCHNGSVQLIATPGHSGYQWTSASSLDNPLVSNPVATPLTDSINFICTSVTGNCHGRDSVFTSWKRLKLVSTVDVNCKGGTTGKITVSTGPEWIAPVEYAVNTSAYQPGPVLSNLPVGTHTVKVRDATGCIDSLTVTINQAFPDLLVTDTLVTNGSCTGTADGAILVTATGGKPSFLYSSNGTTFQAGNSLSVSPGTYTVSVKDANGCTASMPGVVVRFNNTMTLSTGIAPTICEGTSTTLPAATNGQSVVWSPAASLNNATALNPVASPTSTTQYYITSTLGLCDKLDSVTVFVNPAPIANAGKDSTICFGGSTQLSGSGGVEYSWTPGTFLSATDVRDPLVTKPATTTYYLTVTDANGCVSLTKGKVVITVSKPAQLFIGRDTAIAMNQPLQLLAKDINGTGFIKYTWTPSTGLNSPFIPNPIAVLTDYETNYVVTASTASSCEGIAKIKVTTYKGPDIYVANVFTPNGDNTNDILRAFPVGMKSFSYFKIFNRFGQLVFTTINPSIGWDGRVKGNIQTAGTYVWIAAAVDYRGNIVQRKGTTTIIQ